MVAGPKHRGRAVGGKRTVLAYLPSFKGEWIGGGDVKLGLILGLLAGTPLKAMLMLFIASLIGTLAAVPAMQSRRRARG